MSVSVLESSIHTMGMNQLIILKVFLLSKGTQSLLKNLINRSKDLKSLRFTVDVEYFFLPSVADSPCVHPIYVRVCTLLCCRCPERPCICTDRGRNCRKLASVCVESVVVSRRSSPVSNLSVVCKTLTFV